ncbi:MAG: hypothetical protein U9Q22_02350 [Candidatus Altiarchaeota archaeon]|nr:hypothetical protein [Candidatus Altiarchaeota archaeon]
MDVGKGLILLTLAAIICFVPSTALVHEVNQSDSGLVFFYSSTCPHCKAEKEWLKTVIKPKYPDLVIEMYDVKPDRDLFKRMCEEHNTVPVGVPRTFVDGKVFIGFTPGDGELIYQQGYEAYRGYSNQIEYAIMGCLNNNKSCPLLTGAAIEASRNDPRVKELVDENPGSLSNVVLINDSYLVAWWTQERIKSNLYYPNVLVYVDAESGEILRSEVPSGPILGLDKPIQSMNWIHASILSVMILYLLSYLVLQRKLKWDVRYWIAGFTGILIVSFFVLAVTTPEEMIEKFARGFPLPVFVFIIALADGFNPCAFTVLIVLLSLLTHTRSRKRMGLIGSIFIFTSGVMYFIFIMLLTLAISWLSATIGGYEWIIWTLIGLVVVLAGIINIKDFFFFKKGVSLGISADNRGRIFGKAGGIVRNVRDAETNGALTLAVAGVILLAVFVNLVELGCTAMLPTIYIKAMENKSFLTVVFYTAFYSLVYIIPLLAILGNFLYSFKSERLNEEQGRVLKLVGGVIMLILGLILLLKPELLMFG